MRVEAGSERHPARMPARERASGAAGSSVDTRDDHIPHVCCSLQQEIRVPSVELEVAVRIYPSTHAESVATAALVAGGWWLVAGGWWLVAG